MRTLIRSKLISLKSDKKFSEILTGSVWALVARVIATVLAMISSIVIAKFYGAEAMGIVAMGNSFLVLTTVFTVLGTNTSLLRLIPEHLYKYSPTSAYKVYHKAQLLVIIASFAIGILCFINSDFIAQKIFSKPHLSYLFRIASIFVLFKSLMLLNTQAVRGLRLIKAFALMQVFPHIFTLLVLILLKSYGQNIYFPIYALFGGFAITGIFGWMIMMFSFYKIIHPSDSVHSISTINILSISLPMLLSATMTFVIAQTGVIMLGVFCSEAEVGYYAIAVKLATLTSFFLGAVNSMAGPKFSELFHSKQIDELLYVAKKSAKLIFWTTIPILAALVVLGKLLLSIAFGSDFTIAYPALVLLVMGQFVHSISGATGLFMNMTNNQSTFRNIVFIAAAINICVNFLLTPRFGIIGAATAAVISLVSWNIATLWYIKVKFGKIIGYFPKFT